MMMVRPDSERSNGPFFTAQNKPSAGFVNNLSAKRSGKNGAREARRKRTLHTKKQPGIASLVNYWLTQVDGTILTKKEASKHNLFGNLFDIIY